MVRRQRIICMKCEGSCGSSSCLWLVVSWLELYNSEACTQTSIRTGFSLVSDGVVCAIWGSISSLETWSDITEPSWAHKFNTSWLSSYALEACRLAGSWCRVVTSGDAHSTHRKHALFPSRRWQYSRSMLSLYIGVNASCKHLRTYQDRYRPAEVSSHRHSKMLPRLWEP